MADRSTNQTLKETANAVSQGNAYRQTLQQESAAKRGLADAQALLSQAQRSGDPTQVAAAQRNVQRARTELTRAADGRFQAGDSLADAGLARGARLQA